MIRNATVNDVPRISEIINSHAELGRMLFKSYQQLYESLRDFAVYEEHGKVIGCVGLTVIWADLSEVRSLAIDSKHRGRGIGRQLVQWTIAEARKLGIRRIMSLTYERAFFERLGFVVVEKESLPLKVWSDCIACSKRDHCDEIAMILTLADVPEAKMPPPKPSPRGKRIPVIHDD